MTENDMRLRLVVRRDGLPEERLMWNVSLETDPTISILLEKVNETIPLEIGQVGLENYIVELHDEDGNAFECLHFQPLRTVLKPDDRVFIRALNRDDNRRRRISGRHQISSDGRRLIDGIPFGRRLLRNPNNRPSITLPPRKRPRLEHDQENLDDDDTPMLLLTNGEQPEEDAELSGVRLGTEFDDADSDSDSGSNAEDGDFEFESDGELDDGGNDSEPVDFGNGDPESSEDDDDLEQEVQDLLEDNTIIENEPEQPVAEFTNPQGSRDGIRDDQTRLHGAFPSVPKKICDMVLMSLGGDMKEAYRQLAEGFKPYAPESSVVNPPPLSQERVSSMPNASRNDALAKTPTIPAEDNPPDEMQVEEGPSESDEEEEVPAVVREYDHRGFPPGSITSGKGGKGLAHMAAVSGSLVSRNPSGDGESTSATLNGSKNSPDKTADEDDQPPSDAPSSSSEDEENFEWESDGASDDSGSDDASDDGDGDDSPDDGDGDDAPDDGDGDDAPDDDDSDAWNFSFDNMDDDKSNDDESSDDNVDDDNSNERDRGVDNGSDDNDFDGDDSNAMQRSAMQSDGLNNPDNHSDSQSDDSSGPEEKSAKANPSRSFRQPVRQQDIDTSSSEDSSDDESSEAESDSESEGAGVEKKKSSGYTSASKSCLAQKSSAKDAPQTQLTPIPLPVAPQAKVVPPGAGKESTKRRNARRKAAKKAKMLAQEPAATGTSFAIPDTESPAPALDEKALFEAKRRELLEAIANGGVEVGPFSSHLEHPNDISGLSTASKRKRDQPDDLHQHTTQKGVSAETPESQDTELTASAQKRPRLDVGAGRRLVFGALGLRNPKTKEDEEALRAKLMKAVRPLQNQRLNQVSNATPHTNEDYEEPMEEPDSWKDKILYRAVECCQAGIELSEPPFPFVQRWDPQQQDSWSQKKNKRGGQSKRTLRNQAHFYDDTRRNKKRKHDESAMWDEEGHDDTFHGFQDSTYNADIALNYDDLQNGQDQQNHDMNEPTNDASQFTDMDDLPSLPSDLSTLPILRPGEVEVGMVITWQQWSCSSATSWQPQISNVTGVVVRIDDDATGLEVCLAKRDRYLDRNEKKYDDHTGQRIYDRFEAPDLDDEDEEDEGEDEGFRTIGFDKMQQPRIVQQPLVSMDDDEQGEQGDHPDQLYGDNTESAATRGEKLTPMDYELSAMDSEDNEDGEDNEDSEDVHTDTSPEQPDAAIESANGKSTNVDGSNDSEVGQGQQGTELAMSDSSQISSPSRQLHESTSQAMTDMLHDRSSKDAPSHEDVCSGAISETPGPGISTSVSANATQLSAPLFDSHEDEIVAGTPKVIKAQVAMPPSSGSSARSGRQPDYTMDATEPDSFKITDDGLSTGFDLEDRHDAGSDEDFSTPTPKPARLEDSGIIQEPTDGEENDMIVPRTQSSPSSLASINTVWFSALTSRNTQSTQSPSKSQCVPTSSAAKTSQRAKALEDREYDEAMRRLDNTSDGEGSLSRITDSFKQSSQLGYDVGTGDILTTEKSPDGYKQSSHKQSRHKQSSQPGYDVVTGDILTTQKSPPIKLSPPPTGKRRSPKQSSQFQLPPGSQLIELSSDSESVFNEDYADEEVDGTYSPELDSFPRSNGWVHKKTGAQSRNTRSTTGPIKPRPAKRTQILSSSQSHQSNSPPATSSSNLTPVKPRRKTSSRY
ncbi:hypothetical protein GGR54DRAFT_594589 [Hypoxylon sp. NC1633]|nr:hypothetical protein GGR54DRAFT_594589 [Hypoxylon sp. NC1633]